jgi:Pyruvate/2-oxoacid:ferredoxin oxidoreductase delta subunit
MLREIVHIDENLCNGCGECVPECHEGALQIIDGKARLVSDLLCDGLGACLNNCPQDAISIEKREAEPYNEQQVMESMVEKGVNTVIAHIRHLLEHNEMGFYGQAIDYLIEKKDHLPFSHTIVIEAIQKIMHKPEQKPLFRVADVQDKHSACPGTTSMHFSAEKSSATAANVEQASRLENWPVQMHLINPDASYFKDKELLLAADCVAFSMGNFHQKYLVGKCLAIACPKLDDGQDVYIDKLRRLIDEAKIQAIHVMMMQVPCCGGLKRMVEIARVQSTRKIPAYMTIVGIKGEIISENKF